MLWVTFEPNNEHTWEAVTRDVEAFLTRTWQDGGLVGSKAREAFAVTCDTRNNPIETRHNGELHIDVAVAPIYPAEFVLLRITVPVAS